MTRHAPAKINLGLEVLRRRVDGFHDINTVFHRIALADTLTFARREHGIALTCSDPAIPADERNLCIRAARALFEATGYDGGVAIDLFKRIPDGAGLGGGSSDAATVLRALPELCGIDIAAADLHAIAVSIGSDVPFFLHDGSAHATGRGEQLRYFDLKLPYAVLLVHPGIRVATAWAYGALALRDEREPTDLPALFAPHPVESATLRACVRNDFEPAVFAAHPRIGGLKHALLHQGAEFALMSGSGSSVFGLFTSVDAAGECAVQLSGAWRDDSPLTVHVTPAGT